MTDLYLGSSWPRSQLTLYIHLTSIILWVLNRGQGLLERCGNIMMAVRASNRCIFFPPESEWVWSCIRHTATDAITESTHIMHHPSHLARTAQLVASIQLINKHTHIHRYGHLCDDSSSFEVTRLIECRFLCPLCPLNIVKFIIRSKRNRNIPSPFIHCDTLTDWWTETKRAMDILHCFVHRGNALQNDYDKPKGFWMDCFCCIQLICFLSSKGSS